jgi:hypothetical protein
MCHESSPYLTLPPGSKRRGAACCARLDSGQIDQPDSLSHRERGPNVPRIKPVSDIITGYKT